MRIGGLQKQSLIDYPGRVSAVIFLTGCNFRCPYCHNAPLVTGAPADPLTADTVIAFLNARKGFLDGVVISGGEPTLQPDLPDLCRSIRSLGLAVKLDTNGSRPAMLHQLLTEGLIDALALDIKTAPSEYARFGSMLGGAAAGITVLESLALLVEADLDYECRTTCAAPFVTTECLPDLVRQIRPARRWALQPYRPSPVLDPVFMTAHAPHPDAACLARFQQTALDAGLPCIIR